LAERAEALQVIEDVEGRKFAARVEAYAAK
jgi:hypothetical protein